MFNEAFALALRPFVWALGYAHDILFNAGAVPAYVAMFTVAVVMRLFMRPIVGEKHNTNNTESKKSGKAANKKSTGGD